MTTRPKHATQSLMHAIQHAVRPAEAERVAALFAADGPEVIAQLAEIAGSHRIAEAVTPLVEIAKSRAERAEDRVAACAALGRIGDPGAIPALEWICAPGGIGVARLFRGVPSAVRVAAVRALGAFPDDPAARTTLRLAADDTDGAVCDAAGEILHEPFRKRFGAAAWEMVLIFSVREIAQEDGALGGELDEQPLAQVCQKLGALGRDGALHLAHDQGVARIWFESNRVVAAECAGREDDASLAEIAGLRRGLYLFVPGEAPPRRTMNAPAAHCFGEAARRRA